MLERELGTSLPADLIVNTIEQTAKEYTLVLPPKQTNGDLTDEELAGVAGGRRATRPHGSELSAHKLHRPSTVRPDPT